MVDLDQNVKELSFVKRGKNRRKVMKSLNEGAKIPTKIAENTGILPNHIIATLNDLKDYGLVECINPEVRKGKLYRLTEKGEEIIKKSINYFFQDISCILSIDGFLN